MTVPKPFQQKTVESVLDAFRRPGGSRRFLVADEVGLGKTVVAEQVIREMMKGLDRPLRVFYLCSSLAISHKNRRKLLEVVPPDVRKGSTCVVDRLTLLPAEEPLSPELDLHLYVLTPDTSLPIRGARTQRRDGRQEERALVQALLEAILPSVLAQLPEHLFQRGVHADNWAHRLQWARGRVMPNAKLQGQFRSAARREFDVAAGQHLAAALVSRPAMELIGRLRNALAACALDLVSPDLVIFDEFQRFRDLVAVDGDDGVGQVVARLRGDGRTPQSTALLMLSATPYRLYTQRWEDEAGRTHHDEFLDLVEFLHGPDKGKDARKKCAKAFANLADEMRAGRTDSERARQARVAAETILRPVVARTERAMYGGPGAKVIPRRVRAPLSGPDLRVFRHLTTSFTRPHSSTAVPYWVSIPLPMQTMGRRYVAWAEADKSHAPPKRTHLSSDDRNRFAMPLEWPHPRLRALLDEMPPKRLMQPWVAPSLPWWQLGGMWADSHKSEPGKMLVFSRFRAVPQAVAALTSYATEVAYHDAKWPDYEKVSRRRQLGVRKNRPALLALFHTSPWLADVTDPVGAGGTKDEVLATIQAQLKSALKRLGVAVKRGSSQRPIWKLIPLIEATAGCWDASIKAWKELAAETQRDSTRSVGLSLSVQRWAGMGYSGQLNHVTYGELKDLARHALCSPGSAVGRACRRHWPDALGSGLPVCLAASWSGLRAYLDQLWFTRSLGGRASFTKSIEDAVFDGNLESVLDEQLWVTGRIGSSSGAELVLALHESLTVKTSTFFLHQAGAPDAATFSLRCHAALPFTDAKVRSQRPGEAEREIPLRADELGKAFNSPFWPHVLTTTSVGQEGLDFHLWCRTVVHWDLCANPVDMEQREGRVQRFGGLAVRLAVARKLGQGAIDAATPLRDKHVVATEQAPQSVWNRLAALADRKLADKSGLAPWWVFKGADTLRIVFDVPNSEQRARMLELQRQRLLYRLVLGQPDQEDLVELLARQDLTEEAVREASISLSPYFKRVEGRGVGRIAKGRATVEPAVVEEG